MAAEIQELDGNDPSTQTDTIPTDAVAMSPEELVQDLAGQDTTAPAEPPPDDDVPEKYRGKSIKEVVSMHQEAEKLIGSQGSEVGELRKIVDSYITTQIQQTSQEAAPQEDPVDFFEDPEKAVSQAIEQHPTVQEAKKQTESMARQTAQQQMLQKHPDAQQVLSNPAFANWVRESQIRTELFVRADQQFDFNAADELLTVWKERNQVAQQTHQADQQARKQQVAQASTGSGSGANTSGAKRVYRRADIIKLMKNDPDRYDALSNEIMLAYQEGRVR